MKGRKKGRISGTHGQRQSSWLRLCRLPEDLLEGDAPPQARMQKRKNSRWLPSSSFAVNAAQCPGVFNSRHSQTSSMRPSTKMNPIVTNSQICQTFSGYYQRRVECQGFHICKAVEGIFNFAKGTRSPRRTRRYLLRRTRR